MKNQIKIFSILKISLIFVLLVFFQLNSFSAEAQNPDPNQRSKYLDAVREFADNVLKYGRDTYGPKHTPLFVDGLNVNTHEPVKWISPIGDDPLTATETEEWILCNFASQQTLLRTLDGLTTLTGDPKYREAAEQAIKYAFENLCAPNGLFYWGFQAAYDIGADKIKNFGSHSLKQHHPYYALMWEVDPQETQKLIEAFWSAHVLDWSNLDFDRIALFSEDLEEPWNYEYEKVPILFNSKRSWAYGVFFTGTSIAYSGVTLYQLSGQQQPFLWSKRIIERFADARNPKTGISPYFYNNKFDDNLQQTTYAINGMFVFPFIATDGYKKIEPMLYGEDWTPLPWLSVLLMGDMLNEQGEDFIRWSLKELTAWGKASYRQKDNSFVPILADGKNIEGLIFKEASDLGVKGDKVTSVFAGSAYFWSYAAAYRLTEDEFIWQMTRDIALGNNLGNIDEISKQELPVSVEIQCSDPYSLLGFLELYNKTRKNNFLIMAQRIADNIVEDRFNNGFFVLSSKHYYSSFDCLEALALIHLVGTIDDRRLTLPQVWPTISPFSGRYRYKFWASDRWHIYKLVDSSKVPLSLQEAAAIGDVNRIKILLNDGVEVDSWDDHSGATALQRAAISGQKDLVMLLIANGAQIDYMGWQFPSTALHYACRYGHKDVVELLLAKGADVNTRNSDGQTPLHIAVSNNQKDIAELLIDQGADVNIKDNDGQAPQDISEMQSLNSILFICFAATPFALSVILAIPLVLYLCKVVGRTKRFFRYFALLIGICLVEYFALIAGLFFSSEAASLIIFVLVPACVWGVIFGLWLRGRSATHDVLKVSVFVSLYASLTIISLSVFIILLEGEGMMSPEAVAGSLFEGFPWPLNTILGFFTIVTLGTVIAKTALTTGEVALLIRLKDRSASGKTAAIFMVLAIILVMVLCVFFFYKKNQKLHIAAQSGMQVHDVAVTNVSVPSECKQGDSIRVVATVENRGDRRDSLAIRLVDVTANKEIGKRTVVLLGKRQSKPDLSFDTSSGGIASTGSRVEMNGDMNGDGYKDILLSGHHWNDYQGRVFLYFGDPSLNTIPDMIFSGENHRDRFGGYGEIAIGDLNKDGFDDVIIGSLGYPAGKNDGRVYIYYGGAEMDNIPDIVFDGETGQRSFFGLDVAASDVDQDGWVDLLVGAQNYDHGGEYHRISKTRELGPLNGRGRVYLYWGGDSMDTNPDIIFEGENQGDWFGRRISAAGDINGDGYNDILIGARHAVNDSRGRAYLFWGNTQDQMNATCDWTFTGEGKNDNMGSSVCIFDIDSDGFSDVILGARFAADYAGRVYIHWGEKDFDGSKTDVVLEDEAASHMGGDEITCGYFNEDTYGDILAGGGTWGTNSLGVGNRGHAYLFYGNAKSLIDSECDHVFESEDKEGVENWFGLSVSAGDVNNDNYDDVLIGAPEAYDMAGRAYLYYGPFQDTTDITFNWDTTNATPGKHVLKASIAPVAGEADVADNSVIVEVEVKERSGSVEKK
jgi:pectate lyase